jgi:hypothetical protein
MGAWSRRRLAAGPINHPPAFFLESFGVGAHLFESTMHVLTALIGVLISHLTEFVQNLCFHQGEITGITCRLFLR